MSQKGTLAYIFITFFIGSHALIDDIDLPPRLRRNLPSPEEIATINVRTCFFQNPASFEIDHKTVCEWFIPCTKVAIGNR